MNITDLGNSVKYLSSQPDAARNIRRTPRGGRYLTVSSGSIHQDGRGFRLQRLCYWGCHCPRSLLFALLCQMREGKRMQILPSRNTIATLSTLSKAPHSACVAILLSQGRCWCFLHGVATAHSASVALLAARPSVKFFTLVWSHMYVSLYHPMNTINRMCQEAAERQTAIRRSDLPKGSSALACCGSSWSRIHDQFMSAWQLLWKASETAEVKLAARSVQL